PKPTPSPAPAPTPAPVGSPMPADAAAPSPTGRNPTIGWTPYQQAVWNRMKAEGHPWYKMAISLANATGTRAEQYGDIGSWATLAYQMTGDAAYAQKAWAKIRPKITVDPGSANYIRQTFLQYARFYDWLSPGLTAGQKAEYAAGLNRWAEYSLGINTPKYTGGFRVGDSDQTIGQYFGLAFTDLALGTNWLSRSAGTLPVGGLTATGSDPTTVRNAVAGYVQKSAGGEFLESTEYNLGTLQLLFQGVQGVRTATGKDYFPEVTALIPQVARAQLYSLTPDLRDSFQWGDTEKPGALELYYRGSLLGTLAGLTRDDPAVGPYVQGAFNALGAKYGLTGYGSMAPLEVGVFGFVDPYAPAKDWRGALPAGLTAVAGGQGIGYFRDGWGADGALLATQMPTRISVDHEVAGFGDFRLYRKGEWAVNHPLGYGGVAVGGDVMNTLLVAGLSSMYQRGVVAAETGANGAYQYSAGTTGGAYYNPYGYYAPPPAFLREWTRSTFYLPSADGRSSTVVLFDRVNATDPRSLPKYDRYAAAERSRIEKAPALVQWQINAPVAPTVTAGGLSWATAGGQQVQVSTLTAAPQTTTVVRQADRWAGNTSLWPSQKAGYTAQVTVDGNPGWQTLLNVVQASDRGTELRNTRVASAGGEAQGALVQRGGLADALVLFGSKADGRVLSAGYTVGWTGTAAKTDVHLVDLDPSKSWTAVVDGGAAQKVTVSSQGVATLAVSGAGAHTVKLVAG
ncbi:MAG: hypothetical protein K2X82_16240, partial [Gemmataceae bacterium]|nr:hypothetical protein [Gemmataceae bacterium]